MYVSDFNITLFNLYFFFSPAPSQPPRIIRKKLKGKSVNIAWEHVEPLADEAPVNGYKVSKAP